MELAFYFYSYLAATRFGSLVRTTFALHYHPLHVIKLNYKPLLLSLTISHFIGYIREPISGFSRTRRSLPEKPQPAIVAPHGQLQQLRSVIIVRVKYLQA